MVLEESLVDFRPCPVVEPPQIARRDHCADCTADRLDRDLLVFHGLPPYCRNSQSFVRCHRNRISAEEETMGKRIAVMGVGALGGYVGGYLAHGGHDVTLIDMWPENIEAIRKRGLELDGVTP